MKINHFLSVLFLLALCLNSSAQTKTYGQVHYSLKTGDTWGGLIKTNFTGEIDPTAPSEGIYTISIYLKGNLEMNVVTRFNATSTDGRAFHEVFKGERFSTYWKSPTGASLDINWVYFNKSIDAIFKADLKPFDFEMQFADGSAIKYYLSPAY